MYSFKHNISKFNKFNNLFNSLNTFSGKNFLNYSRRFFSTEVTPKKDESVSVKTPEEYIKDLSKEISNLPKDVVSEALKTGAELYLTPEKLKKIEKAGFNFRDNNPSFDITMLDMNASKGWVYQYLKNMLLLNDYDNIFRSFLQAIAQDRKDGMELVTEPRLCDYIYSNVRELRIKGYNLEFQDLKIIQDYSVLRVEIYKNLHVDRYKNKDLSSYSFSDVYTPLGNCRVATLLGEDISYFHNDRPYILATTMRVKTPMKLQVFNQNLSKKLHGGENGEVQDYVVRFESQLNLNDFAWILPTQNKPKRLRQTKIADFNNVLRGNPYFVEKIDLVGSKEDRYAYMQAGVDRDEAVLKNISTLNNYYSH